MSEREQLLPDLEASIAGAERALLNEDLENRGIIPGKWTAEDHIPPELVDAVIWAESRWNPNAQNPSPCGPNAYAQGLGQFCVSKTGNVSTSLEVSDYQAVTGTLVRLDDIYDPHKAMELTAFGLGDRYERLKEKTGKKKPRNWYVSVVGYSPLGVEDITDDMTIPNDAQEYVSNLRQYVRETYDDETDKQIAGESPRKDKSCDDYGYLDPNRYKCTADLLLGIGKNAPAAAENVVKEEARKEAWRIGGISVGAIVALIGIAILANKVKGFTPQGRLLEMAV